MANEPTRTVQLTRARVRVLRVQVLSGPDAERMGPVVARSVRIGTSPDAELTLTDRGVSRLHLELAVDESGVVRLRDLGSKNGVWLAGARIRDAELQDGARIVVGASTLEIGVTTEDALAEHFDDVRLGPLVGASPPMQRLFARALRVAGSSEAVLVHGESGTGKELLGRALHDLSPRAGKPFVILDAAAISGSLAEMELFGHARGAFTGSHGERAGAFERAHGGTLFLDEIGELPLELQPRLLRAVEDRTVQRIGEHERRRADARVVCATHRSLAEMVNAGTFREDLYHRLTVLELEVPPLRVRGDDIARIAYELLEAMAPGDADARRTLAAALATRGSYPWPGNVRELRNFVTRLVVTGELPPAAPSAVAERTSSSALPVRVDAPFHEAKQLLLEAFERRYVENLLDETGGNVSEASRRAGLSRGHLSEMIGRLGLRRPTR